MTFFLDLCRLLSLLLLFFPKVVIIDHGVEGAELEEPVAYSFPCCQWLAEEEGDGEMKRTLLPTVDEETVKDSEGVWCAFVSLSRGEEGEWKNLSHVLTDYDFNVHEITKQSSAMKFCQVTHFLSQIPMPCHF